VNTQGGKKTPLVKEESRAGKGKSGGNDTGGGAFNLGGKVELEKDHGTGDELAINRGRSGRFTDECQKGGGGGPKTLNKGCAGSRHKGRRNKTSKEKRRQSGNVGVSGEGPRTGGKRTS